VRDNEEAARAAGIDVLRTKLAGMAVSAALTGAGGTLFAAYIRIIDPPSLLTLSEVGVKFALIVLIGGTAPSTARCSGAFWSCRSKGWLRPSSARSRPAPTSSCSAPCWSSPPCS
jgi:branched-chain amino acid transport system permease protein